MQQNRVSLCRRTCLQLQVNLFGEIGLWGRSFQVANEQTAIGVDSGIHAASVNRRGAIVVRHGIPDANTKPYESLFEWRTVQSPTTKPERQVAAALRNISRKKRHIAVPARGKALQLTVPDAPVLQRVRPVFRPGPLPDGFLRPCAAEGDLRRFAQLALCNLAKRRTGESNRRCPKHRVSRCLQKSSAIQSFFHEV